jgi:hypothetical protein
LFICLLLIEISKNKHLKMVLHPEFQPMKYNRTLWKGFLQVCCASKNYNGQRRICNFEQIGGIIYVKFTLKK